MMHFMSQCMSFDVHIIVNPSYFVYDKGRCCGGHECTTEEPTSGKQYALTGGPGDSCIANGNTWAESEVEYNG